MTDYVRRIVSGKKSRYKDEELGLELDLVYMTDRIIIMGYPATGVEGLYRNRRDDIVRFLEHKHGQNYWVFNFCPLKENSYNPAIFGGRVSRYPFPDHQSPPFVVLPLVTREIDTWLKGSNDRVAVLHCKAGKGRSGTIACAYLLAHDDNPAPPKSKQSYSAKEWTDLCIREVNDISSPTNRPSTSALVSLPSQFGQPSRSASDTQGLLDVEKGFHHMPDTPGPIPNPERSFTDALKGVLDLHTARRMKALSEDHKSNTKVTQGVSVPSQRRFLYYWTLFLTQGVPAQPWFIQRDKLGTPFIDSNSKVCLTQVKVRIRTTSGLTMGILKTANTVISQTKGKSWAPSSHIWAALARYDDGMISVLEKWERRTRGTSGDHPEPDQLDTGLTLNEELDHEKWDKRKLVQRFAKFGVINKTDLDDKEGEIVVHTLKFFGSEDEHRESPNEEKGVENIPADPRPHPERPSDALWSFSEEFNGLILEARREIRVKFYMGQVVLGWLWLIPIFHMPQPSSSLSAGVISDNSPSSLSTVVSFTSSEIDSATGFGSAILDVELDMSWVIPPSPDHQS